MEILDEDQNINQLLSSISNSFGDYVVKAPIGRGAGSFVVQVQSRKSKRDYAVKVIDKKATTYKKIQQRLLNEIEIHKHIKHNHIVKLINVFEDADNHYLMLEICEQGDLFNYLKCKGKLNEDEARKITYQLALGIKYLHENKIIHRDLKLGNILLASDLSVKICDFGLAIKLHDFEQERNTLCGTPNYISPEIINREPYGIKIDCWSFGCILYALITGKPPFESLSVQETLKKVKDEKYLDIPQGMSSELKDLLKNTINWDREARFDIQQVLSHPFYQKKDKPHTSISTNLQQTNFQKSNQLIQRHLKNTNHVNEVQKQPKKDKTEQPKKGLRENNNFLNILPNNNQIVENNQIQKASLHTKSQQNAVILPNSKKNLKDSLKNKYLIVNKENIIFSEGVSPIKKQTKSVQQINFKNKYLVKLQQQLYQNKKQVDQNYFIQTESFEAKSPKVSFQNDRYLTQTNDRYSHNQSQEDSKIQKFSFFNDLSHNNSGDRNLTENFVSAREILNTTSKKIIYNYASESFNLTEQDLASVVKLSPLKMGNIAANSFDTKNGKIQIEKNKNLRIYTCNGKMQFNISPNGLTIRVIKDIDQQSQIKAYNLQGLPKKYHELYQYAKKVCDILKSKTVKISIEDEQGKFYLMENDTFEAKFKNGFRSTLKTNSNMMKIKTKSGMTFEINIEQNLNNVNEEIVNIVKTTLNYLNKVKKQ